MPNLFLILLSFTTWVGFLFWQSAVPSDPTFYKEIGTGGALIFVVVFVGRYLIKQVDKRDQTIEKKDEEYKGLTKELIALQTTGNETNKQVLELMRTLDGKL